jgi:hypothetical protein
MTFISLLLKSRNSCELAFVFNFFPDLNHTPAVRNRVFTAGKNTIDSDASAVVGREMIFVFKKHYWLLLEGLNIQYHIPVDQVLVEKGRLSNLRQHVLLSEHLS